MQDDPFASTREMAVRALERADNAVEGLRDVKNGLDKINAQLSRMIVGGAIALVTIIWYFLTHGSKAIF